MTIRQLKEERAEVKETKVQIVNPDTQDFTVNYHNLPFTIRAGKTEEFGYDTAHHIKKHLAMRIAQKRTPGYISQEMLDSIYKEILTI